MIGMISGRNTHPGARGASAPQSGYDDNLKGSMGMAKWENSKFLGMGEMSGVLDTDKLAVKVGKWPGGESPPQRLLRGERSL